MSLELEKLCLFLRFYCICFYVEFRNIPTSVVVSYQTLFDKLKIFIYKKWDNFKSFSVLLLCVAAAVNCILRRGRELRKCNYFQTTHNLQIKTWRQQTAISMFQFFIKSNSGVGQWTLLKRKVTAHQISVSDL